MRKKLLLADDSVVIQKLIGLSFANENIEIVATDNGDDALERAREVLPDVILADVVMPGKSGYEVCQAIKQNPELSHIPVLLLTGTFEAFDEARAEAVGANGQITKPFEAQALVSRVKEVMNAPATKAPAAPVLEDGSDFFDANAASSSTTISPSSGGQREDSAALGESADLDLDGGDFLIGDSDQSNLDLFGQPGDGAPDELETSTGEAALGQPFAEASAPPIQASQLDSHAADLTPPALDAEPPALAPEPPPSTPGPPASTPGPPPSTSGPPALPADATIVAGLQSSENESTGDFSDPLANLADDLSLDDLLAFPGADTASASASEIDVDSEFAAGSAEAEVTIMAGVTDGYAVSDPDPRLAESSSADPQAEQMAMPTTTAPESLNDEPASRAPDDLDFAFDVSEQQSVTEPSDPLEQSYSSLMDFPESQILTDPSESQPNPLATDYDVSSSDLATAAPLPPDPEPTPGSSDATQAREGSASPATDTTETTETTDVTDIASTADTAEGSLSIDRDATFAASAAADPPASSILEDELSSSPEPDPIDVPMSPSEPTDAMDDFVVGGAAAESEREVSIPDLSPIMEERIREALEKIAWEAFSDISETIVKEVMARVEKIAWEVIPQMAESLVREEIRIMKGDDD